MSIVRMAVVAFVTLYSTDAAADPKYVMPRELVEHARELGCSQVEDFFEVNGMIGPPYVYGYLPGRTEDSAAFWCERTKSGEREFFLAVMVHEGRSAGALACPRLVAWHNYPGGLGLYRNPKQSLEAFTYLDAPKQKGPRDRVVVHNAIQSSAPGQSTEFYCHDGRWLVRSRH